MQRHAATPPPCCRSPAAGDTLLQDCLCYCRQRRAVVSLAGSALNRSRDGAAAAANSGAASGSESRLRAEGVTALEAAAALNNDPQVLLLDIR